MTASNIQITQGSGTRLATNSYTEGAVTVHDEKMILGEQYHPTYVVTTQGAAATTGTANSHVLQIMAGSSLKLRIRRIEMWQVGFATAAVMMQTHLYRLTSAGTGGTSLSPVPLDTADAGAGATAQFLPTVKGTETSLLGVAWPYMMQTLAASSERTNPIVVWDFDFPRSKPVIVPAGTSNGIAVKNVTAVSGATVSFQVWFDETTF